MAFVTDTGAVLLNPAEKGLKYSLELKHKKALTNNGKRKFDEKTGKQIRLTKEQLAYRAGYLACASDSQKAFRSKHPRYKRKTTNR